MNDVPGFRTTHSASDLGAMVMMKYRLTEVFYLKECAKNNCFSMYVSHSYFLFGVRILLTGNLWGHLMKPLISTLFLFWLGPLCSFHGF